MPERPQDPHTPADEAATPADEARTPAGQPGAADDDPGTPADEARAAAEEAAAIGGPDPYPDLDPAERPVAEGGGGEAEGFEQAEEELRRNASHDDAHGHPLVDRFEPEGEFDRSSAEYAEADEYGEHEDRRGSIGRQDDDR